MALDKRANIVAMKSRMTEGWERFTIQQRRTMALIREGKAEYVSNQVRSITSNPVHFVRYIKKKR